MKFSRWKEILKKMLKKKIIENFVIDILQRDFEIENPTELSAKVKGINSPLIVAY